MAGPGWQDIDRGYKRLRAELFKLNDRGIVTVGVQDGEAGEPHAGTGKTNAQVATWFEYGTERDGEQYQPARPFVRPTVDENGQKIYELIQRLLIGVVEGRYTTQNALAIVGEWVLAAMKRKLRSGIPPPLAESTIRRKGSSKPGIDTAQMLNSLTYKVRSKDEIQ